MALSVSTAFTQIQQELNLIGQQIDQPDVLLYLTRAVAYFSTTYVFPTAIRNVDKLLFTGVRKYGLPSDFGTLIEPQRYPAIRSPHFAHTTGRQLNHWPYGRQTSIEYANGTTPYLNAIEDAGLQFLLTNCEDTTIVVMTGDGSGISVDKQIYTEGLGSLRFTVTAVGGTTTFTFTLPAFDNSDAMTKAYLFLDLIAPSTNTANLTNVIMRIGNSATAYHQVTATTRHAGDAIGTGYGQIGFDLTAKTDTGTIDDTNTTFLQIVLTHGVTGVNGVYHLDNIFISQGILYQIPYYTINNVVSAAGVGQSTVLAIGDSINLPVQTEEAIIYKALELIASSPNVANAAFANYAARELKKKEDLLSSLYPSQRSLVSSTWWKRSNFRRGPTAVYVPSSF